MNTFSEPKCGSRGFTRMRRSEISSHITVVRFVCVHVIKCQSMADGCFVCMQSNTHTAIKYSVLWGISLLTWEPALAETQRQTLCMHITHTNTHSKWKIRAKIWIYRSIPTCKLAGLPVCLWFATPISYEKMRQSCNYGRSTDCHNPSPLIGQNMAGFQGNQRRWGWCQRAHGCAWGQSLARLYHKVTSNKWGLEQTKFNGVRGGVQTILNRSWGVGQTILKMWTEKKKKEIQTKCQTQREIRVGRDKPYWIWEK